MISLLKTYPWRTCSLEDSARLIVLSSCETCLTLNAPHVETDNEEPRCLVCGEFNSINPESVELGDYIGSVDLPEYERRKIVGFTDDGWRHPLVDLQNGRTLRVRWRDMTTSRIGLRLPPIGLYVTRRGIREAPMRVIGHGDNAVIVQAPTGQRGHLGLLQIELHYHCHRGNCPNPLCD